MRSGYAFDEILLDYELEAIEAPMRVNDRVLKCVVFLGVGEGADFKPYGTGFLIITQQGVLEIQYVVTALHVIVGFENAIVIRVNKKNGEPDYIKPPRGWYVHPDHGRYVDAAVAPIVLHPYTYDVACVRTREFLKEEALTARDVGIGDELFYPSLFMSHRGVGRNHPVMRFGTLAAMPVEPVVTKSGPVIAYLMEGRSMGGHSGAPVFVNFRAPRTYNPERPVPLQMPAEALMPYRFLGVLRSYLKAKDTGEYLTEEQATKDLWVNSGISTVVPASDIIDILMQPELEEQRVADANEHLKSMDVPTADRPTDDSEVPTTDANPDHLKDFARLVDVAARKKPKEA